VRTSSIPYLPSRKISSPLDSNSGSGKKKSNEQKILEALKEYRERQLGYENKKEILDERNSYSKTDNDATFMRMKDDHMKNGQLKPGYNVQLAVEGEYVIGVGIFPDCNDPATLIPTLDMMYKNFPWMKIKNATLDAGYESEENYLYLEGKGIPESVICICPSQKFQKSGCQ